MAKPGYSDIVSAMDEAAMRPDLWAGTLEMISDYLGADSGMVLHLSASGMATSSFTGVYAKT